MKLRLSLVVLAVALHARSLQAACDETKGASARVYAVRGETVYDGRSKLMWARCSLGQHWQEGGGCTGAVKPLTWFDAMDQRPEGWRLPTADELKTLISPVCRNATIDQDAFPGMDPNALNYWSSTPSGESDAYYVNFRTGLTSVDARDEPYAARLVRDGAAK